MEIFTVGGAVRDHLMGIAPKDRDYVVVGATVEQMLAEGFQQVGADFPVFLHPQTKDEYALARTERKSGTGYHGFLVNTENVTLEEDLSRRDLTINAMALSAQGELVDPWGGAHDIASRVLRHVGPAFAEDPLRVLRVARFLARLGPQWTVAPATMTLMQQMVDSGELDSIKLERVWKEISRGLLEPHAHLMVGLLLQLGLFEREHFRAYRSVRFSHPVAVARALAANEPLEVRFALQFPMVLSDDEGEASRIPAALRAVSRDYLLTRNALGEGEPGFAHWGADARLALLMQLQALRGNPHTEHVLRAMELHGCPCVDAMRKAIARLRAVDNRQAIAAARDGQSVETAIRDARLAAVEGCLG